MDPQLLVFHDFHMHGASAPEWNQKYSQLSPGVMRSVLFEWSAGHVHVFRKWMSERVVQEGGLPSGQLCFSMLANDRGGVRVQGRELGLQDLLILRGGDEFEIQRPAGVELLSVTFSAESFSELLDAVHAPAAARRAMSRVLIRPEAATLDSLRRLALARPSSESALPAGELMRAMLEVLTHAGDVPLQRAASVAAARVVKECQRLALAETCQSPSRIDQLSSRLGMSRRALQLSFNSVAGTSPLAYLRSLRLNAVRRRLLSTSAAELSVSTAAMDAGFDHLGHFAGSYRALFGELPSETGRRMVPRANR